MEQPIWTPSPERVAATSLDQFRRDIEQKYDVDLPRYVDFHRWSVEHAGEFWREVWDRSGMQASVAPGEAISGADDMLGTRWFPGTRMNFAQNILGAPDDSVAIRAFSERRAPLSLTRRELHDEVSRIAAWLQSIGVREGDRIAGWLPNIPEAVVAMLACTSIGAIWCSGSPEFGGRVILDRFQQVEPKVLFAVDGYQYGGKAYQCVDKLQEIAAGLPTLAHVVVIPLLENSCPALAIDAAVDTWDSVRSTFPPRAMQFAQLPFDHPVYILFTSGTTGKPKCIVHGAGGTLLKHYTEHALHFDIQPGDVVYQYATLAWSVWNWILTVIAWRATLVIYDGSPLYPTAAMQFDLADRVGLTHLGTSAKFIDSLRRSGVEPIRSHKLEQLRMLGSTGSPLLDENYVYVYENVKRDVFLSSYSGGTDLLGCLVGGDPTGPVWPGEISGPYLGLDLDIFDETGKSVRGTKGELVCKSPFPSMPVGFWNDPQQERYRKSYFDLYPNVWAQHDLAMITKRGGYVIFGRSDTVLNPRGVRIGTAEIYQQIQDIKEIADSVAVGQEIDGDVRIVLFVQLASGAQLDAKLDERIRTKVRAGATSRHVPEVIVAVEDIPRTMNGKTSEVAVREAMHGRKVPNVDALANPESLRQFVDRPELRIPTPANPI